MDPLGQAKGLSLPVFTWSQQAINDSTDALSGQFSSKTSNAFSLYVTSIARNFWLTGLGRVCAIIQHIYCLLVIREEGTIIYYPTLEIRGTQPSGNGRRYVNSLTASICQEGMVIKYSFVETIESFIRGTQRPFSGK